MFLKKRPALALLVASPLMIIACSSDNNGMVATYDPDEATAFVGPSARINGQNVAVDDGSPPTPSDRALNPTAPTTTVREAPSSAEPGDSVTVELEVDAENDLADFFAQFPGASRFFRASAAGAQSKPDPRSLSGGGVSFAPSKNVTYAKAAAAQSRADGPEARILSTIVFTFDVPSDLDPGRSICFDFSAQDTESLVSNVEGICVSVTAPAPVDEPPADDEPPAGDPPSDDPPMTGQGESFDCYNPELLADGSTVETTLRTTTSDGMTSTLVTSYIMRGTTIFNGQTVRVQDASANCVDDVQCDTLENYFQVDNSSGSVRLHGNQARVTFDGISSEATTTFSPPIAFFLNGNPGDSFTQQYTGTTESTVNGMSQGSFSFTTEETVTYVGQESITVPAGTFQACRFSESSTTTFDGQSSSSSGTIWVSVGDGLPLRQNFDGDVTELVKAIVNGTQTGN